MAKSWGAVVQDEPGSVVELVLNGEQMVGAVQAQTGAAWEMLRPPVETTPVAMPYVSSVADTGRVVCESGQTAGP